MDGRLLRFEGLEITAISAGERPSPSEDFRRRKRPVNRSARLPRKKTSGRALHFASGGEKIQKQDRKSTRLNSSHGYISYAVFCLKKKKCTDPRGSHGRDHVERMLRALGPAPVRPFPTATPDTPEPARTLPRALPGSPACRSPLIV